MTFKDQLEVRAKNRAKCREAADKIVALILTELDKVEESLQSQTWNMVVSEFNIAMKKDGK